MTTEDDLALAAEIAEWHAQDYQRAMATLARLAEQVAEECLDNDEPPGTIVPPVLVPEVGQRYHITVDDTWGPLVLFHATLTDMVQDDGDDKIEFEFDNGVSIRGLPDLLPDGWVHRDDDSHFTFRTPYAGLPAIPHPFPPLPTTPS